MSEQEDPVSRRQFFRGMTGGLFRAIGEMSGLDKLVEEHVSEVVNLSEDDILVAPEVQAANLSQIFSFLEQQSAMVGAESEASEAAEADAEPAPAAELLAAEADPVAEPPASAPEAEAQAHSEPD